MKEYACTALDVIARRTRLGFLNVQAADEALPRIVQIMGKELGWSEEKKTVGLQVTFFPEASGEEQKKKKGDITPRFGVR